ncbi:hypothetical protein [Pseudomonas putida]|uniref:hypothetical protein n=1 Tax=Pseudomonas putida TaxID=303 RepID=UPI002022D199|nr:hypothetical protein [Pseudomonas putida]MCL8306394.1 hypothetical protein [Pseudomonas putida]
MSKPDNQVNELHLRDPKPGDFWHERFCPYHIVLAVTPAGVVIADKTRPDGDSHYTFDLESAREITHEEHAKAVRYSSGNGFAADVVPVRAALSVREWKAAGSKYIAVAEQKAAPHAGAALMDTNKMRDISREQFEAKFPVPAGIAWDERLGMYKVVDIWKLVSTLQIGEHNSRWEGWQASREAVVVELPGRKGESTRGNGFNEALAECRAAIEAQRVKCK